MIKLNNKNITYVALADSNNSLKAPKEIWYADSSNSVKLVYRRKDALIEGEDYEKYHWVKGDGSAYIDTNKKLVETDIITTKFVLIDTPSNSYYLIYGNHSGSFKSFACIQFRYVVLSMSPTATDRRYSVNYQLNSEITISHSATEILVNGTSVWRGTSVFSENRFKCYLFATGTDVDHCFNGKVGYFNISDNLNLIPCKLLKPVPKWLDANGIRRNVGECGMIDLVSGKFYGNVNSVGTFTVENYYERKEWLSVTTSSQSNTYLTLALGSNNNFSFKRVWTDNNFLNTWYFYTVNYVYYTDSYYLVRVWDSLNSRVINPGDSSKISMNDIVDINSTKDELLMNGIPIDRYGYGRTSALVINNVNSVVMSSLTSSVVVDNKERYIPCTLTMDLPASMDANNIARTKGTSGMWDLVSDRFYGNVANSGTFKAVNLVEGVDYEVHQWLVAEIYPQTSMMSIPINSSNFSYIKENGNIWANLLHFVTSSYSYFTDNADMNVLSIWDNPNRVRVSSSQIVGSTMEFNSTSQGLSVNNVNITQYGFPVSYIAFSTAVGTSDIVTTKTSAITVDSIERYIPVKLLKSIPSKYDANGVARNAGECGMYDTVNDLFYGNAASSGSFTVEDDN